MLNVITIGDITYVKKDGVFLPLNESKSSRKNSWITVRQITDEYPELFDKFEEIFASTNPSYSDKAKDFALSTGTFLEKFGWLSWKQFDSIWRMCSTYQDYLEGKDRGFYTYGGVISVQKKGVSFTVRGLGGRDFLRLSETDKGMDKLHAYLFGCPPVFEEEVEEGMTVKYRSDGSRYFALPTGDEDLSDFMHFGIEFKGLRI